MNWDALSPIMMSGKGYKNEMSWTVESRGHSVFELNHLTSGLLGRLNMGILILTDIGSEYIRW